jgi:hypothetical protein
MSTKNYLEPISNAQELVVILLHRMFGMDEKQAYQLYQNIVKKHIEQLKDTLYLFVETNYVDKVYRDSYYHYYSSKLSECKRNCIRISFFDGQIRLSDFWNGQFEEVLQQKYKGFIILRPTEPYVIGRSVISPCALKANHFCSCTTKFTTTVYGQKFSVDAFPHSSQDTETITCAETTLWALMEYFGNKYPEYSPVLPSKILHILYSLSVERQMPSRGLDIKQMSYALKEVGFGARIYSRKDYGADFEKLVSTYVESGIPLIIALENKQIGHALLCIGHADISEEEIKGLYTTNYSNEVIKRKANRRSISIYDYDDIVKEFVFIDDNQPVYQKALLSKPALHYDSSWHSCEITHFIVPLYTRIYLEAREAKNYLLEFLLSGLYPLEYASTIFFRMSLTSNRSFKDRIAHDELMQEELKTIIIETSMPKFVWVAELGNKSLFSEGKANVLMVVDATEANIYNNKPLIIAAYQNKVITFDNQTGVFECDALSLTPFSLLINNLKKIVS